MEDLFKSALENFPEYSPRALSQDPPVVLYENFLSGEEVKALLNIFDDIGYTPSGIGPTDGKNGDGIFEGNRQKTSYESQCDRHCYDDPTIAILLKRLTDITQLPEPSYIEGLRVLRYKAGDVSGDFVAFLFKLASLNAFSCVHAETVSSWPSRLRPWSDE
jgi:hypothetical protein